MTMKRGMIYFYVVFASILICNTNAVAQDEERPRDHGFGMETKHIPDLSADQESKIEALKVLFMKESRQLKNKIGEKHAALETLSSAYPADLGQINKTIDEIGALTTELMKKKETHRQEVRKLLDDRQRVYFDTKHPKRDKPDDKMPREQKGRK